MPFIVHSPFDGTPVKVRDKDIGRAIRDKQQRIFYALPRSNGEGYYTAPTRQGGLKDEQRYDRMMQGTVKVAEQVRTEADAHDATGRRRAGLGRKLVKLIVLLIVLAVAYYVYQEYGQKVRQMFGQGSGESLAPPRALVYRPKAPNGLAQVWAEGIRRGAVGHL